MRFIALFFAVLSVSSAAAATISAEKREADALCLFHGQGCWKREAEEKRTVDPLCLFHGQGCWKRDAAAAAAPEADPLCLFHGQGCWKRDAEATLEADPLCLFHGQGCWKRDTVEDLVARCNAPGGACDNAARDLKVMHTAARALLEYVNEN